MAFDKFLIKRIAHVSLAGRSHQLVIGEETDIFEKLTSSLPSHFVMLEDAQQYRVLLNTGTQFIGNETIAKDKQVELQNVASFRHLTWDGAPYKTAPHIHVARRLKVLKS